MRYSVVTVALLAFVGLTAARPSPQEAQEPVPVNHYTVAAVPVVPPPGPVGPFRVIPSVVREEIRDDAGQYSLAFRSADGSAQSSYGVLKPNPNGPGHFLAVTGSYSYTAPDGTPVYVSYIADEKGFQIVDPPPVATVDKK